MKKPTVHPDAFVAFNATVRGDVRIEEGASIFYGAVLRGDRAPITIGPGSNIQENCVVHVEYDLPVVLGRDVTVGHGAILHGCTVGDETLIGMGAIVLNGAKIGRHCLIGAGALVTQNMVIPDGSLAFGSPAKIRGTLVSCNQFAIIFGMLVVYFVNYLIRNQLGDTGEAIQAAMVSVGWRRMFLSEAFPAATFLLLILFVPETPRYLTLTGRDQKALQVLTRINGAAEARTIHTEIRRTVHAKTERLFAYGAAVILIGILLSFFQQAIGINVVLYYAPRIFAGMGASGDASMLQTVVMGVVNILFTVVAIFTVDRVGRKPLLIVGSAGMMIGMAALAALSFTGSIGIAALVFIIIYTASFMMSWGPICWVLISEIFPNTIRSQAVAVAVAAQWISNFLVSATFPSLSAWSVGRTYCIYALMALASALFVWKWVPETKGRTLEEMSKRWRKNGD